MRTLLSWLREFVDIEESPRDLAHALTMAGMAVDAVEEEGGETVFEFDITSNRPDAMNHFGIAREIASIYSRPLRMPEIGFEESGLPGAESATVSIEDPDSCTRYVGRVFEDILIQPAPDWMRRRLELCGVRSINNLADLTNYVLLEIGQPTHAFDLDTLAGQEIVVRRARRGETLVTLDGTKRDLSGNDLVICDAEKPVALAGVMGGAETEITERTRRVLLEAAWFRPSMVRNTSRRFKLFTDASHRFERGADWNATTWAADRIATLLGASGAGTVLAGRVDCHPGKRGLPSIRLDRAKIRSHLGVDVPAPRAEAILRSLGFDPRPDAAGWTVPAESHRLDVAREIDLIEEVGRIYGFERVPATLPPVGRAPAETPCEAEEARLRAAVRGLGFDEMIGFSFLSSDEAGAFGDSPAVPLRNPLSNLWGVMRNSSVPTMVGALEWNLKRNQSRVRLAEFGRVYRKDGDGYREPRTLTLGATGAVRPLSWAEQGRPYGFYDLKGDVAALIRPFATGPLSFDARDMPRHFRSGHAATVRANGELLASFGELDPGIARRRKLRQPVLIAEIRLDPLYRLGLRQPGHRRLPRVPAVSRDFSLLVPNTVRFSQIAAAVGGMKDLASLDPVEIFRGRNVPEGSHSLLLRASWQRLEESLTDEEVNRFASALVSSLEPLGISRRS